MLPHIGGRIGSWGSCKLLVPVAPAFVRYSEVLLYMPSAKVGIPTGVTSKLIFHPYSGISRFTEV